MAACPAATRVGISVDVFKELARRSGGRIEFVWLSKVVSRRIPGRLDA